jgi:cytochrome c5
VDAQQHDKTFVTTFLLVLGFLGTFTFAISVIAGLLSAPDQQEAGFVARIEERTRPVGQVITDEKMLLAATPASSAAARPPMGGAEVVTKVCGACHASGVLGAPKIGDTGAWTKRGALNALVASAIKGKNAMPPRGGDPSLSDDEIKAAVQEMLK